MREIHQPGQENKPALSSGYIPSSPVKMPTFYFDDFALEPAIATHLPLAQTWTAADPDHAETTPPEFWLEQSASTNSFLLYDKHGPVFFFKMILRGDRDIEIHMQFSPSQSALSKLRTINGLTSGFRWLEKRLAPLGYQTVYFNSKSQPLIEFCQRRLGFEWDGRRLEKALMVR